MPRIINALISDAISGNAERNFFAVTGIAGASRRGAPPRIFHLFTLRDLNVADVAAHIRIRRSILISAVAERIFERRTKPARSARQLRYPPGGAYLPITKFLRGRRDR